MNKRKQITFTTGLLAAAIVLPASTGAADQNRDRTRTDARDTSHRASTTAAHDGQKITLAPSDIDRRTAENFTGKDVRGSSGNHIGNVADVIVDPQSGKIVFFAVSRGGIAGIGDTLRLVPYSAIRRATNDDGFTVPVTESQWDKMPAINEQDFEAGRINITADQQRQLADVRIDSVDASEIQAENRGDFGQRLARAAKLRGKEVRANNREVGEIEDIVLDFDRGTATALMDPEDDFARAEGNYLVPLSHFQFTAERDALTTTLAATDFANVTAATDRDAIAGSVTDTNRASTDERRANTSQGNQDRTRAQTRSSDDRDRTRRDEPLTPTGRTDNANPTGPRTETVNPDRNVASTVQSAARSVQQIWDAHPELAKLGLRVTTENNRLIFRGTVPNTELWERAKDTAESVIRGIEIENRISIGKPTP